MNRFLFILLLGGLLQAAPAAACDICGCGVSYYNPFLFPHLSRNYIGLSSIHRAYHTLSHDGSLGRERYHTVLLTAQYALGRKFQLLAMLPWQNNTLRNEAGERRLSGAGDISVLGQYRLWEHSTDKGVRQVLLIGAGMKFATGRYVPASAGKTEEQNFQLGTGSNDLLLNGSYRISLRRLTFSANASYKYNTGNHDGFRYGDVLNGSLQVAYRNEWRKWSATPYLQLSRERMLKDADRHVLQTVSGGTACYAGSGVDVNTRKLAFGVNYQFAVAQELAGGQINVRPSLSLRTSFTF